jgi:sugar-specific transcriptional regulator TrmB
MNMSIEKLVKTFKGFKVSRTGTEVYVCLSKKGPCKARDIITEMKLTKQQLYPCLKNLQRKGLIYSTDERPAVFYALPFERVLDMFAAEKINEAEEAQKHKLDYL